MVADLISVEEAYGVDPATGQIDMDKFRRFAAQQEASLANMRANTQLSEPLTDTTGQPRIIESGYSVCCITGCGTGC